MKPLFWFAVGGVLIAASISQYQNYQLEADKTLGQRAAETKIMANQNAAKAKERNQDGVAGTGAIILKKAMKDPASFKLESLYVMEDGAACYHYRAVNSFGASLPTFAVMLPSGKIFVQEQNGSVFDDAWDKYCRGKSGRNITQLVDVAGILN